MQKTLRALVLIYALHASNSIADEFNMRPGLWEITTTSDLLLLAPHIPKDQMQEIQALAKEYGLDMPSIENGAAISKTCITQQMSTQKTLPSLYQAQTGCTSKKAIREGNRYKIEFTCNSAELNGNGTAEGHLTSPEQFTGLTKFSGNAQGNPINEKAEIIGQWLNASCGDVNPM